MTKLVTVKESHDRDRLAPATITVRVGATVTWKNTTDAAHPVTGKGNWVSYHRPLPSGTTVSHTVKKTETYTYDGTLHPAVKGAVVVTT